MKLTDKYLAAVDGAPAAGVVGGDGAITLSIRSPNSPTTPSIPCPQCGNGMDAAELSSAADGNVPWIGWCGVDMGSTR